MGRWYGPYTSYDITCIVCGKIFDRDEAIDKHGYYDEICSEECLEIAIKEDL
jgi:predicted nucleic acid-binding Zn ribbon protein